MSARPIFELLFLYPEVFLVLYRRLSRCRGKNGKISSAQCVENHLLQDIGHQRRYSQWGNDRDEMIEIKKSRIFCWKFVEFINNFLQWRKSDTIGWNHKPALHSSQWESSFLHLYHLVQTNWKSGQNCRLWLSPWSLIPDFASVNTAPANTVFSLSLALPWNWLLC